MLTPDTHARQEQGPRLPVARGGFLPRRPRCGGWALYLNLRPARPQLPRDVYGSEGIKRFVSTCWVAFSDLKVTVEIQLAEEDKIVTRWTARGTHSGAFLGLAPTHQEKAVSGIGFDRVVAAASMRRGSATILSPGRCSTAGSSTAVPP